MHICIVILYPDQSCCDHELCVTVVTWTLFIHSFTSFSLRRTIVVLDLIRVEGKALLIFALNFQDLDRCQTLRKFLPYGARSHVVSNIDYF
jgi:hypothetical protein